MFNTPRSAALLSVASNTTLVIAKLIAGVISGSVSVISEAIHSGLDLVASVIALISVNVSGKPADETHQYGHGKVENISAAVEAILIVIAGALIIREAVEKMSAKGDAHQFNAGMAVMLVSVVMNIAVSRLLFKVGRKHESQALIADGHHLSTDVITSAGVLLGLLLVKITGLRVFDAIAAIGVAALITWIGLKMFFTSVAELLDHKLPDSEINRIIEIIELHAGQFAGYHKMRTRKSGAVRYIDLHMLFPQSHSVACAHEICDHIEKEIKEEFSNANITIHLEPAKDGA